MGFVTDGIKGLGKLIWKFGKAQIAKRTLDAPSKKPKVPAAPAKKGGLGSMMGKMKPASMLKGAAAMVILAAATWLMAKALQQFSKGVSWKGVLMGIVAMGALAGISILLGTFSPLSIAGAAAMVILAAAMWVMGKAMQEFAKAAVILIPVLETLWVGLDVIMGNLTEFAKVIGDTIVGSIEAVATVIDSIGDSIARVVESYGEMKTGTIEATTEQIERLAKIPPDNLNEAAAGITAMKDALDGFSPGFIETIGGGLKSMFAGWTGSDTTSTLEKLANLGTPLAVTAGAVDVLTTAMAKYVELPIKAMVEPTKELVAAMSEFKKLEGVALNVQVAGMPEFNTTALEGKLDEISTNLDEIDKKLDTTGPIAQANRLTSDELFQLGK
jgi:hypothetical protein